VYYLWSAAVATVASTSWNFVFSELWVFRDRNIAGSPLLRLLQFFLMNGAALLLRSPVMWALTSGLGIHYQISNLFSIGLATTLRYLIANQWIWQRVPQVYAYNIHDIVTIVSAARLPELKPFRVLQSIERPTLRISIGMPRAKSEPPPHVRRLDYSEGFGIFGFRARIDVNERVDIVASPLLGWSPHVLYTNVVEPVLRWVFVEKGYALVHGACLTIENRACLITSLTDTGKTTTLLQLLRHLGRTKSAAFLADDLTIVRRDGHVLSYPKPLTISAHTARAIQTECLVWYERLFLPFQSRIHSRKGRRFAHALAKTRVPAATINAYAQYLVPPPKYTVEQLLPGIEVAAESRLSKMFIIQRGTDARAELPPGEALEILMRNCEDAYGFPPYSAIEAFLKQSRSDVDLAKVERDIIANALRDVPTRLLRRLEGDWWPELLADIDTPASARSLTSALG